MKKGPSMATPLASRPAVLVPSTNMPRPSSTHLSARLRQLVLASPPETSLFYARLWYCLSLDDSHEALHALALAFLQDKQPYSALHLVQDTVDAGSGSERESQGCGGCAMIVAKCCEGLGRFSEGQAVLQRAIQRGANLSESRSVFGVGSTKPIGIPSLCPANTSATSSLLLAKLTHKGKLPEAAVEQYTKCLQEDPWLWEAFTGLCDIGKCVLERLSSHSGSAPALEAIFPDPPPPPKSSSSRTSRPHTISPNPNPMPRSSASEIPGFLPRKQSNLMNGTNGFFTPDFGGGTSRLGMMGNPSSWE